MGAAVLDEVACLSSVNACRLRVARLNDALFLDEGAENLYVTDSLISIGSTPDVEAGTVLTQKNGCGDICIRVKGNDTVPSYSLTMSLCHLDAELIEMLTGATVMQVGGVTIGLQMPKVGSSKPSVSVEAWSEARTSTQQATDGVNALWFRWVWPNVTWTIAAHTIEEGILVVQLTGTAEENDQMGTGPAEDFPEAITAAEAWFLDDDIPDAACGYQAMTLASSAT